MATATEEPPIPQTFADVPEPEFLPEKDVNFEVVDGQNVEIPWMGVYEASLAIILHRYLDGFAWTHQLGQGVVEMLFLLDPATGLRRKPDSAFVSAQRWPIRRPIPRRMVAWPVVPDLAVEVISPANRTVADIAKVHEYFRHGLRKVWLVLPELEVIYVYSSPTDARILSKEKSDVLDGEDIVPGFRLPLASLFLAESDDAAE